MCGSPNEWPWIKGHRSAWLLVLNTRLFQNKCIRNQIWPCHTVGQGQPRLIICANLVGLTSPMLHTKSQGLLVPEKKTFKGFLPYVGVVAILVMWPVHLVKILANLSSGLFIWNLSSNGLVVSEETMFWCVEGTPIWATLAEKLKVNLDLWNLFIANVLFGSTYQVRIMTGLNSFQKMKFSRKNHLNALGSKFDLDVK